MKERLNKNKSRGNVRKCQTRKRMNEGMTGWKLWLALTRYQLGEQTLITLPGHGPMLHCLLSQLAPVHKRPPLARGGLSQVRRRVWIPPAQDLLQWSQNPQQLHPPCTVRARQWISAMRKETTQYSGPCMRNGNSQILLFCWCRKR